MKRRGFLHSLLLPFLPTPDLPMEKPLNLIGTTTGRFSCSSPNFQVIGRDIPQPLFPLQKAFLLAEELENK